MAPFAHIQCMDFKDQRFSHIFKLEMLMRCHIFSGDIQYCYFCQLLCKQNTNANQLSVQFPFAMKHTE